MNYLFLINKEKEKSTMRIDMEMLVNLYNMARPIILFIINKALVGAVILLAFLILDKLNEWSLRKLK